MRFLAVWARVVGGAAARRALPVWSGVAILSAVLFGGNAMPPHALTAAALGGWRFGVGLAATWLVLVIPSGRAMVDPAATAWLRALPVPRWRRGVVTWVIAVIVQAPWTLLWVVGEGPVIGAIATVMMAATMLGVAEVAGRVAWAPRAPRWKGTIGALVGAHRRMLARGRGSAAVRAAGVAWLGGAAAGMVAHANQLDGDETVWWCLAVASVALPIAVGAFAGPVVDGDRRLGWILTAAGCRWPSRVAAQSLVLGVIGAGLGVIAASGAVLVGDASPLPLAAWLALLGAGFGGLALRAGAWAASHDDGDRIVIGMAGAAIGGFVALGVLGPLGEFAVAATGFATAVAVKEPA